MVHEKADGIAAFATAKTFVDLLDGRDGEGRRFFIVKRAKAQVIDASFLKLYKATYYFNDVNAALNLLYRLWGYQGSELVRQNTSLRTFVAPESLYYFRG